MLDKRFSIWVTLQTIPRGIVKRRSTTTQITQLTRNFVKFIIQFQKLRFMFRNRNIYLIYCRKYIIYFRCLIGIYRHRIDRKISATSTLQSRKSTLFKNFGIQRQVNKQYYGVVQNILSTKHGRDQSIISDTPCYKNI